MKPTPIHHLTQDCNHLPDEDHGEWKAAPFQTILYDLFTEHPHSAGESYLRHLWFTVVMTLRLQYCAIALLMHGLLPFLFTTTVSRNVRTMHYLFRLRSYLAPRRVRKMEQAHGK